LHVQSNASLRRAIEFMNINKKGVVVVLEGEKPVGILTERDIVEIFYRDIDFNERVDAYARKNLITTRGDRTIGHALNLTIENNIRRVVVTDDSDRFLGVITQQDLLKPLEEDFYRSTLKVRHIIDTLRKLISVPPYHTLREVLKLMVEHKISAVPIIRDGEALGIITEKDILKLAERNVSLQDAVGDYISTSLISASLNTDLIDVVKIMNGQNIRRLVITDNAGRAINMITIRDVLKNLEVDYGKFLERKLRYTKEVLNLLPEMLLEATDTGKEQLIIWANDKVLNKFGSAVLDKPITIIIPQEQWDKIRATLVRINKIESVKFQKDDKNYELSGFFIKTEGETEIGRFQLILRDITEDIRLATTDPLTTLYNRRFVNEFLSKEIERSKRLNSQFSVVMSDIDNFKSINDTYGHSAGDRVLSFLASLLLGKLRKLDVVGRFGGDEFVFIMPVTGKEAAVGVVERLRILIVGTEIPLSESARVRTTVSFGVATYPEDGSSPDDILNKADERLYKAKKEGKNKVYGD
jgi:diguanylate cyclase (GGDEF)-like protein